MLELEINVLTSTRWRAAEAQQVERVRPVTWRLLVQILSCMSKCPWARYWSPNHKFWSKSCDLKDVTDPRNTVCAVLVSRHSVKTTVMFVCSFMKESFTNHNLFLIATKPLKFHNINWRPDHDSSHTTVNSLNYFKHKIWKNNRLWHRLSEQFCSSVSAVISRSSSSSSSLNVATCHESWFNEVEEPITKKT